MKYFTFSYGLSSNPQIPQLLSAKTAIRRLPFFFFTSVLIRPKYVLIGWGYKSNTVSARALADKNKLKYLAIEEGFISWLDHPVQSKPYKRLSYIVDEKGIYYDASKTSGLDDCINYLQNFNSVRCSLLINQITHLGISKYNHKRQEPPQWLLALQADKDTKIILLVDQTYDDASIKYANGSARSFTDMLDWAAEKIEADSTFHLVIKSHPDTIVGKKRGYLSAALHHKKLKLFKGQVHILTEDVSPKYLLESCCHVATVSSQLGFEALLFNRKVTCFAWPFYAGRGLTDDRCSMALTYSRPACTISELVHAALIQYPVYLFPDTQKKCKIEDIINYLHAHFLARAIQSDDVLVASVSLWKRSFIPEFIRPSVNKIRFNPLLQLQGKELVWGMKPSCMDTTNGKTQSCSKPVWRIEDGFIRSVGLGADLRRPSSLVIDDLGMYYNGLQESRLENLLNTYTLSSYDLIRSRLLTRLIVENYVTKYNIDEISHVPKFINSNKEKHTILVVGQFEQDLSIKFGSIDVKDNLSLLKQVRIDFPDSYIIFKEHPDVYSGVRPGKLCQQDFLLYGDEYLTNTSTLTLFQHVNRVCTICSLCGFEALLRGIKVTTYGLPFYAGWGLTDDRHMIERRVKIRTIEELCFIVLVIYPRYVNWKTRSLTTPESVIESIINDRKNTSPLKSSWLSRQNRKLQYLLQSILRYSNK